MTKAPDSGAFSMERVTRIELALSAWEWVCAHGKRTYIWGFSLGVTVRSHVWPPFSWHSGTRVARPKIVFYSCSTGSLSIRSRV